ncbi:MAG: rane protein, partial [Verrucomicrobiota bacterium]
TGRGWAWEPHNWTMNSCPGPCRRERAQVRFLFRDRSMAKSRAKFFPLVLDLTKQTAKEWIEDKAPQLGAALAYYTVFSLAPMILLLLAVVGVLFRDDPVGAWTKVTEQMSYFLDRSAVQVVQEIAQKASSPARSTPATIIGLALALFGATGVFGQLQDALNTIWGVKPKPGTGIWGFIRSRFLSFAMLAGIGFLLLVSLVIEALLKALSHYLQGNIPGGLTFALTLYFGFDLLVVAAVFGMIFKVLPNAKTRWRDVWIGATLTAIFFLLGKWAFGVYLGSGAAASAYGATSSLISLLLWIYYSSQILLFGAEFTQVYANRLGARVVPDKYSVRVEQKKVETKVR